MLLKSGINLKVGVIDFINNGENIIIFSPFIKIEALKKLLKDCKNCEQIVVRWLPRDIIDGVSDLEVYDFCKEKGISLYRNPRIHLKVFLDNYETCIIGSANITDKALALNESYKYNYEVCTHLKELDFSDKLYFQNIITESTFITDQIFGLIKDNLDKYRLVAEKEIDFEFNIPSNKDYFLISELPMTDSVEELWKVYLSKDAETKEELQCAIHDISVYNLPNNLNKEEFVGILKINFFEHAFIKTFICHVSDLGGDIYFGSVKDWFQKNTSSVPIPRKWELTENVQILYKWITYLNPAKYKVDRPNYSERLKIETN